MAGRLGAAARHGASASQCGRAPTPRPGCARSATSAARRRRPPAPRRTNPAAEIAAWGRFEQALSALARGDHAAALPIARDLAARFPAGPVFQSTYARALLDAGQAAAAVRCCVRGRAPARRPVALPRSLGGGARGRRRRRGAARGAGGPGARRVQRRRRSTASACCTSRPAAAARQSAAFEQATTANPSNATYWSNLGNARRALGEAARRRGRLSTRARGAVRPRRRRQRPRGAAGAARRRRAGGDVVRAGARRRARLPRGAAQPGHRLPGKRPAARRPSPLTSRCCARRRARPPANAPRRPICCARCAERVAVQDNGRRPRRERPRAV